MPVSMDPCQRSGHRELPEKASAMAHAGLRIPENAEYQAEIGACLRRARSWLGWSLKELAGHLKRDERQIARWETGVERTQVDAVFAVPALREPFAVQLARLAGADVTTLATFRGAWDGNERRRA